MSESCRSALRWRSWQESQRAIVAVCVSERLWLNDGYWGKWGWLLDNRFSFVPSDKHPKRLFLRTKTAKQLPHPYRTSTHCSEFTVWVNVALKGFENLGEMMTECVMLSIFPKKRSKHSHFKRGFLLAESFLCFNKLLVYCVLKLNYWSFLLSENPEQIKAIIFYI